MTENGWGAGLPRSNRVDPDALCVPSLDSRTGFRAAASETDGNETSVTTLVTRIGHRDGWYQGEDANTKVTFEEDLVRCSAPNLGVSGCGNQLRQVQNT